MCENILVNRLYTAGNILSRKMIENFTLVNKIRRFLPFFSMVKSSSVSSSPRVGFASENRIWVFWKNQKAGLILSLWQDKILHLRSVTLSCDYSYLPVLYSHDSMEGVLFELSEVFPEVSKRSSYSSFVLTELKSMMAGAFILDTWNWWLVLKWPFSSQSVSYWQTIECNEALDENSVLSVFTYSNKSVYVLSPI